ncbi:MAG: substrate-binding domain-containing protein [Pacificimonas sp.]|nr:substrate-binding domain-containing protein [Pacificimonas sp.]
MTRATVLIAAAGLALAACGNGADEGADARPPIVGDPNADVSGPAVEVAGSSTVFPFTSAVADYFAGAYPEAEKPEVRSTGTAAGIAAFCAGGPSAPDIADASRRMTAEEFRTCAENGVDNIRELVIGFDGIALVEAAGMAAGDSDDQESAEPLNLSLAQIFEALAATAPDGEPNRVMNWSAVSDRLPDRPIRVIVPPETSGTRQQFEELVMLRGCRAIPALAEAEEARCTAVRSDGAVIIGGEDDSAVIEQASADQDTIGIVGYSYLVQNPEAVQPIKIDNFLPEEATIMGGGYPASRRLYLYVNADRYAEKPSLPVFVDTFLAEEISGDQGVLVDQGFVPQPIWNRETLMNARKVKLAEADL